MLEKSQDILRISLAAAALLVGGSVAYHYAIYIPEKDQEAQEAAAAQEAADERRQQALADAAQKTAQEKRTAYKVCVSNAFADYHSRWESNCKSNSDDAAASRSNCLARGFSADYCAASFPAISPTDCRLPNAVANEYDEQLKDDKARCLQEASNGLESPL
jgi:hypothetical protein